MRIRMRVHGGKAYSGSPFAIVEKMRRDAILIAKQTPDADAYMAFVSSRSNILVEGETVEARCESFIQSMIHMGHAVEESKVDGRPDDFPESWKPTSDRQILEALIAEVRNALLPASMRLAVATPEVIERVLSFTEVCSKAMDDQVTIRDACAYILDQADRYDTEDSCWVALTDVVAEILDGEVQAAKAHGELDRSLYKRLETIKSK